MVLMVAFSVLLGWRGETYEQRIFDVLKVVPYNPTFAQLRTAFGPGIHFDKPKLYTGEGYGIYVEFNGQLKGNIKFFPKRIESHRSQVTGNSGAGIRMTGDFALRPTDTANQIQFAPNQKQSESAANQVEKLKKGLGKPISLKTRDDDDHNGLTGVWRIRNTEVIYSEGGDEGQSIIVTFKRLQK